MRSKWVKVISIALAVSLIIVAFAGCGSKSGSSGEVAQDGEQQNKQQANGEISKPVEIMFWEQDDPKTVDPIWDEIINELMEQNQNITVTRTHYETEALRQNFQTAVLANQGPQVISCPDDNIGILGTSGTIAPLDDMFSEDFIKQFAPNAIEGAKFKGKLYGIPYRIGNCLMLFYNKEYVDKAPETMDELIAKAKELTTEDRYGLAYNLTEPFWFVGFLGGYNGRVFDDQDNITLNTEAMKNALQLVHDFKFKHKIVPAEADADIANNMFKEKKVAFLIDGPWRFKEYEGVVDFGIARIPKINSTDTYPAPYTGAKVLLVNKDVPTGDKNEYLAVKKFIELVNTKENQLKISKGAGDLPTNLEATKDPYITDNELLKVFTQQMLVGTSMPIIPEMRAVWDGIRPGLEAVMADSMTPAQAAEEMQEKAEQLKKEMLGQ